VRRLASRRRPTATRVAVLAVSAVVFGLWPAARLAGRLGLDARHLVDFRNLWNAGKDVLAGASPYHPAPDPALATTADCLLSAPDCFVYPPPAAFLAAPLSVLPFAVAGTLFVALSVGAVCLALRLAGLRDWRCYGLALASTPVLSAIEGGTLTPLLALGLAIAWRYRDRRAVAAAALAGVIVAKLFLWPFLLWFVATRRIATAALGVALAAVTTTAAWAAIGFAGLSGYPDLLDTLAQQWQWRGYSPVALGLALGLPEWAGRGAAALVGAGAIAALAIVARRPGGERRAFALALAAALLLSPIVWLHYFALLLVPLAIARPRLAPAWALPLAFVFLPGMPDGDVGTILAGAALAAATIWASARRSRGLPPPARWGAEALARRRGPVRADPGAVVSRAR
jgi:Glycosyltransferase family 87